nr:hypothetical protein [Tanacetum cinerariifolium]
MTEDRSQLINFVQKFLGTVKFGNDHGLQVSQDVEDSHVPLTPVQPDGQQESSSVSSFVTSMLNPTSDAGVESIFTTASSPIAPLPTTTPIMTPSTIATITTSSDAPIPTTTIPSTVLENLSTFDSTNQFAEAVSKILENDEFLRTIDENMKKIIKGQVKSQVKEQVSRILPQIEESVNAQLEAEVLTKSSNSSRTSYAVAVDLTEIGLKKILIEKMEGNKSIQRSDEQRNLYKALVDAYEVDKTILESYGDTTIMKRRRGNDDDQEGPSARSDRGSNRRREGGEHESASTPSEPAIRNTLIDFSNFIMNRLCVDTLTLELLAGPTYELMRGSCTILIELEYHLEEVYKATTDQLDWVNPKGQQYPHSLLQPLPLIPDNRGRRVIPFAHFINNDLEYLRGGTSSRKYTTSVTKTKAADYGKIKWID